VNTHIKSILFALVTFAVAGTGGMVGCQSAPREAGSRVRFHNWWNFYEEGLRLQEAKSFAAARKHFEIALGLRSGATYGAEKDIWRARTYGLHFVEGYFPNRELGISLFYLGNDQEAEASLLLSLSQTPSSRAKHYLNLVRTRQLAASPAGPPVIHIENEPALAWSKNRRLSLTGSVSCEALVREIVINNRPEFIELAEPEKTFHAAVDLQEGHNVIEITAADLLDRKTSRLLNVVGDWSPPVIAVRDIRDSGSDVMVDLVCLDDFAMAGVVFNGRQIMRSGDVGSTGVVVTIQFNPGQQALLSVTDLAGNETKTILSRESFSQMRGNPPSGWYAEAPSSGVPDVSSIDSSPVEAAKIESVDRMKPSLRLRSSRSEVVVFGEEYFLDGEASDGSGVAAVEVNGENILTPATKGAQVCFFARRIPLDVGTNQFEVVARDATGNQNVKTLNVVRRLPAYQDDIHRLSLGITPVVYPGERADSALIQQLLRESVLADPSRFHILERDEGWDYILREQQLSLTDLVDPRSAKIISKLLPADLMLMSTIMDHDSGLTILARIVNAKNGQMLFSDDIYIQHSTDDMSHFIEGLVLKIEQRFPLIAGRIVKVGGNTVQIDVGQKHGLQSFTRFLVIPGDGEKEAGLVRQAGDEIVELEVNRVGDIAGWAGIHPEQAEKLIREGDYIHAR